MIDRKFSELRIFRAFLLLAFAPIGANGERSFSLARVGNHEVRLVEFPFTAHSRASLWIELFAHDERAVIDSASCLVFEEVSATAERFVQQALHLQQAL